MGCRDEEMDVDRVCSNYRCGVGSYSYTRYRLQEDSYTAEMRTGERALQERNYTLAETSFTHATRTKASSTESQRYLTQTQTYVAGQEALAARKFDVAKRDFMTVKTTKHGAVTLINQAQEQLTLIKRCNKTQDLSTTVSESCWAE